MAISAEVALNCSTLLAAAPLRPRKKPFSSMSPLIAERNGSLVLAIGASGGPRIISAVLQACVRWAARAERSESSLRRRSASAAWLLCVRAVAHSSWPCCQRPPFAGWLRMAKACSPQSPTRACTTS